MGPARRASSARLARQPPRGSTGPGRTARAADVGVSALTPTHLSLSLSEAAGDWGLGGRGGGRAARPRAATA
jgi:hypothetical protein